MGLARDGIHVMVNPAYLRLFGYPDAADLAGNSLFSDIAPQELPRIREFARRRSTGEPAPAFYETRGIRRSGEVFDMAVAISTYELDGQVYTIGVLRDISEQKRTEATLRESEAHLSMVFENTYDPLALYEVEAAGVYRLSLINPAFLQIASKRVGRPVTSDEVMGRPYDDMAREVLLLEEAAIKAGREHMDEAVRTGRTVRWDETQLRAIGEVSSERIDIPVHNIQGRCRYVLRVLHDVTERKRAELERVVLSERVRCQSDALLKFSLDPAVTTGDVPGAARKMTEMATRVVGTERTSIWLLDPDGAVMRCLDRYDRTLGQHTAGMEIDMSKYPAALGNLANGRTIVLDDVELDPSIVPVLRGEAPSDDIRSAMATAVRMGGQVRGVVWIATLGRLKKWQPDEIAFGGALGDHMAQAIFNAERERSTRSLHELAGQLMKAEDDERRRIGRDLHDSTGQLLAVLEINMAMLSRAAGGLDARSQALLQECIAQTKQCANSIRTASYLLHPPLLDEMGLVSAVQWQLDGFRLRSGIQVEAKLPAGFVRLPPEDELSLFRVLQEALTNAHRHAGSTLIRVVLEQPPGAVILTISDNGKGIRPAALASFREGGAGLGVGLAGMRERLRQLGGQVEIESGSNGTVLRASLPSRERAPGATQPSVGVP